VTSEQLLAHARDLLERSDPSTAGIWPRATALLTRQVLEGALDDLWRRRAPGVEACSVKAQLLCLPSYLHGAEDLAERVAYTWVGLSRASHQHAYELSPTTPELVVWIEVVQQLVTEVQSVIAPAGESMVKPSRPSSKRGVRSS
jgi:hypothetical protein